MLKKFFESLFFLVGIFFFCVLFAVAMRIARGNSAGDICCSTKELK